MAREHKAATCGVEGKAMGRGKGDEDSCRVSMAILVASPHCMGQGGWEERL